MTKHSEMSGLSGFSDVRDVRDVTNEKEIRGVHSDNFLCIQEVKQEVKQEVSKKELIVVFDSMTGNVESFAKRIHTAFQGKDIELTCMKVDELKDTVINSSVLLLTHTYGKGQVPAKTESFLEKNHESTIGVCVSGNRNWGNNFGLAGEKINLKYGIPLIRKFELRGFPKDIRFVIEWLDDWINNQYMNKQKKEKMEGINYE